MSPCLHLCFQSFPGELKLKTNLKHLTSIGRLFACSKISELSLSKIGFISERHRKVFFSSLRFCENLKTIILERTDNMESKYKAEWIFPIRQKTKKNGLFKLLPIARKKKVEFLFLLDVTKESRGILSVLSFPKSLRYISCTVTSENIPQMLYKDIKRFEVHPKTFFERTKIPFNPV